MITAADLDALLGREITTICTVGYSNRDDNHCAHFVSHVLGYQFGFTCRGMVEGPGTPATIRVHELFPRCPSVGTWESKPAPLNRGLVFITKASNVNLPAKTMVNVPRKHVGIIIGGSIWLREGRRMGLGRPLRRTPGRRGGRPGVVHVHRRGDDAVIRRNSDRHAGTPGIAARLLRASTSPSTDNFVRLHDQTLPNSSVESCASRR